MDAVLNEVYDFVFKNFGNCLLIMANLTLFYCFLLAIYWLIMDFPVKLASRFCPSQSDQMKKLVLTIVISVLIICFFALTVEYVKKWIYVNWIVALVIYLSMEKISNHLGVKMFKCQSDRTLKSHMDKNLGSGLAYNYWNGFFKQVTYREEGDPEPTVIDMINEAKIELSTKDFIILLPLSCHLEKKKENWGFKYNSEGLSEVVGPSKMVNFKSQQRTTPFSFTVMKVMNPNNPKEYLAFCYDFPQIIMSSLGKEKHETTDHRRSENIKAFKKELESLCEDRDIKGIKIIHYDDSKLPQTKNLFSLVVDEVGKILIEKDLM